LLPNKTLVPISLMSSYINTALRRLVAARAEALCEYCLIQEEDAFFGCEVDHIISEKYEGQTEANNLAYACAFCNCSKSSDMGRL
jgi:5-methylcytosine-specific restriction endonuclease McrA